MELRVGDLVLHVVIEGDSNEDTLLFLHGLTDSTAYYRWVLDRLVDRYRVVALDFRGHGRSGRAHGYVTSDFLTDAETACEQAAGPGSVVIAHSFGGLIGAALAQHRPDLVRAVFLEDPLLIDPAVRSDLIGDDGDVVAAIFTGARDYFDMIARWQQDRLPIDDAAAAFESMPSPLGIPYSEAYFPDAVRALVEGKLRFDTNVLDDFATARATRDAAPVFDATIPIEVPGIVLAGDPAVPGVRTRPIDIERLRATSPRIAHQTAKGAGHFMHLERDSRHVYTAALTAFLDHRIGLRH